jgi:CRP/FNR family transcriptional regulator, cyclic AMP receptor protein
MPVTERRRPMFLPKSDVFKDLRQETIDDISKIAVETSYDQDAVLYSPGDPADHFYLLVEGKVSLNIGKTAQMSYVVERLGETFGWPSVVGHDSYRAEARCVVPTTLLKIEKTSLDKVFDAHERSGRKFFRSLAAALGQRLIDAHR